LIFVLASKIRRAERGSREVQTIQFTNRSSRRNMMYFVGFFSFISQDAVGLQFGVLGTGSNY
jgi:hypothetical protein